MNNTTKWNKYWNQYPFIFIAIIGIVLIIFVGYRQEFTKYINDFSFITLFFFLTLCVYAIIYCCKSKSNKLLEEKKKQSKQNEKNETLEEEKLRAILKIKPESKKRLYSGQLVFTFLYAIIAGIAVTQAITVFSDPDKNYYINYAHNFDDFFQLVISKPSFLIASYFMEAVLFIQCGIVFLNTDARKQLLKNDTIKELLKNKEIKTLLQDKEPIRSTDSLMIEELYKSEEKKVERNHAISKVKLFFSSLLIFFEAIVLFYAGNSIDNILNFAFWILLLQFIDIIWCIINMTADLGMIFQWLQLESLTLLFMLSIIVIFHSLSQVTIQVYEYVLIICFVATFLDYKMGWKYVWSHYDVSDIGF